MSSPITDVLLALDKQIKEMESRMNEVIEKSKEQDDKILRLAEYCKRNITDPLNIENKEPIR